MWGLRLLRHRVMLACLIGHGAMVLAWGVLWWSAERTEWIPLGLAAVAACLFLMLLDLPVLLMVSWFGATPLFQGFFGAGDFYWAILRVFAFGSIQWGLIGLVFAVPDVFNEPEL